MSKIISIGTAVPKYGTSQSTILDFMQKAYNDDTTSRKLKILFHNSGINTRYSVLPDFNSEQPEHILFNVNQSAPNVEKRLNVFKKEASLLAISAIHDSFKKINTSIVEFGITHLITVTCTGIYAPGLDSELIEQLNLPLDIFHIAVNFLGCNAAFHALKIADMIVKTNSNAKVLIVCVELCTLHFQAKNNDDNLLSNTIFGDGAAAAIVTSNTYTGHHNNIEIEIKGFYSLLLNNGKNLMGWNITSLNFEMILDSRIPDFIGNELNEIISKSEKNLHFNISEIDKWAIHPGGKKILDTIKKQMQMDDSKLQYSYKILAAYGNMSSPTILFVLDEFMLAEHKPDESIFSIGFGPGLSIESGLFNYVK